MSAHHMNCGCDAAVGEELLRGADISVRDSPPQVAGMHIFAHAEVGARLIHLDRSCLLECRCDTGPSGELQD